MTDARRDINEIGVANDEGESWGEVADRRSGNEGVLVAYVLAMVLAVIAGYAIGVML